MKTIVSKSFSDYGLDNSQLSELVKSVGSLMTDEQKKLEGEELTTLVEGLCKPFKPLAKNMQSLNDKVKALELNKKNKENKDDDEDKDGDDRKDVSSKVWDRIEALEKRNKVLEEIEKERELKAKQDKLLQPIIKNMKEKGIYSKNVFDATVFEIGGIDVDDVEGFKENFKSVYENRLKEDPAYFEPKTPKLPTKESMSEAKKRSIEKIENLVKQN